jgi:anti-sigma-K factor RskA
MTAKRPLANFAELQMIKDGELRLVASLLLGQMDAIEDKLDANAADTAGLETRVQEVEARPVFTVTRHERLEKMADRSAGIWRWIRLTLEASIGASVLLGGGVFIAHFGF